MRLVAIVALLSAFTNLAAAQMPRLYSVSSGDGKFRQIDPATGATIASFNLNPTFGGKGLSLATDPTTGLVYAMFSPTVGGSTTRLITIDPNNGAATNVGMSTDKFAGIAFDAQGNLFGVSGDGGVIPEALYSISKTTGVATFLLQLGNGGEGEALSFNPKDGLLYHASGSGAINEPTIGTILETIDPVTLQITPVTLSAYPISGITALCRLDSQTFLGATFGFELVTISTTGVISPLGGLDHLAKGFAFGPGPSFYTSAGVGCVGVGGFVPVLSGVGTPNPGQNTSLTVTNARGGASALLLFGLGNGALALTPTCSLKNAPLVLPLALPLTLSGVGPGTGAISLPGSIPANTTTIDVYLQMLVADAGAPGGIASTNALRLHIQ